MGRIYTLMDERSISVGGMDLDGQHGYTHNSLNSPAPAGLEMRHCMLSYREVGLR